MNVIQYPIIDCSMEPFHSILNTFLSELLLRKPHYFSPYKLQVEFNKQLSQQKWFPVLKRRRTIILTFDVKFTFRSINCTYEIFLVFNKILREIILFLMVFEATNSIRICTLLEILRKLRRKLGWILLNLVEMLHSRYCFASK